VIFIDSNIWLYAVSDEPNAGKRQAAILLLQEPDICISSQVVNEVLANVLKSKIGSEDYVQRLLGHLYADYVVLEILREDIQEASELRNRYKFSYWDSLIVATAMRANAETLFSEDMQEGLVIDNRMTIRNPFR